MRAVRLPRSWPVRWLLIFLITAGSMVVGCAAPAVDLDGDRVVSPEEVAHDFQDRYRTFRLFVRTGVALADPEPDERQRVDEVLAIADEQAAQYAQSLRDGMVPGTGASNRRVALGLLEALTEYLERGQAAVEADE